MVQLADCNRLSNKRTCFAILSASFWISLTLTVGISLISDPLARKLILPALFANVLYVLRRNAALSFSAIISVIERPSTIVLQFVKLEALNR